MKLTTALRMASEISDRLRHYNGLIGTPGTSYEAFRVKRAWVFGSTVKGSQNPNDLDVLIEAHECGRRFWVNKRRIGCLFYAESSARIDRFQYRNYGIRVPVECHDTALRLLRNNLKMVRFHSIEIDGHLANPRVLIYPRNDLQRKSCATTTPPAI